MREIRCNIFFGTPAPNCPPKNGWDRFQNPWENVKQSVAAAWNRGGYWQCRRYSISVGPRCAIAATSARQDLRQHAMVVLLAYTAWVMAPPRATRTPVDELLVNSASILRMALRACARMLSCHLAIDLALARHQGTLAKLADPGSLSQADKHAPSRLRQK